MAHREAITNSEGELLGYDYIYDDEPEILVDDIADYYEPDDYDEDLTHGDGEIESDLWDAYNAHYDEDPSPYGGTYSEE